MFKYQRSDALVVGIIHLRQGRGSALERLRANWDARAGPSLTVRKSLVWAKETFGQ